MRLIFLLLPLLISCQEVGSYDYDDYGIETEDAGMLFDGEIVAERDVEWFVGNVPVSVAVDEYDERVYRSANSDISSPMEINDINVYILLDDDNHMTAVENEDGSKRYAINNYARELTSTSSSHVSAYHNHDHSVYWEIVASVYISKHDGAEAHLAVYENGTRTLSCEYYSIDSVYDGFCEKDGGTLPITTSTELITMSGNTYDWAVLIKNAFEGSL